MADLTDTAIDEALARGRAVAATEPRAAGARYDRKSRRIVIDLQNGCTFAFPPTMAQGLENASDQDLAKIEILGNGYGLHWPTLDTDLAVPDLLAGLFGPKTWLARSTGRTGTLAKPAAARQNGSKGGRPRKLMG
jgi:hypothetical protein